MKATQVGQQQRATFMRLYTCAVCGKPIVAAYGSLNGAKACTRGCYEKLRKLP